MSVYATMKRPLSMISRMHQANAAADAKRADKLDEGNRLRRSLRAEMAAQSGSAAFAAGEWKKVNDPVRAPAGVGAGDVHPQRAAALLEFIRSQGWSDAAHEPIMPTQTLAEAIEAGTVEARERLAAAEVAYAEHEAHRYDADLDEPIEAAVVIETVEQPRRGPGRPRKAAFTDITSIETD